MDAVTVIEKEGVYMNGLIGPVIAPGRPAGGKPGGSWPAPEGPGGPGGAPGIGAPGVIPANAVELLIAGMALLCSGQ